MAIVVVITGGIASGKSTVTEIFKNLGAESVDADEISRTITGENGCAVDEIIKSFGEEMIQNKALNRSKMRELVFSDMGAKKKLEKILHPIIKKQIKIQVDSFIQQNSSAIIAVQIPLFYESSRSRDGIDFVVTVESDFEIQKNRLIQNRGLSEEVAQKIINSQATKEQRESVADFIIYNNHSLAELQFLTEKCFLQIANYAKSALPK